MLEFLILLLILGLLFVVIGLFYFIPITILDRKWFKAHHVMHCYNNWVVQVLHQPDLVLNTSCLINKFVIGVEWKTLLSPFWELFIDPDVRNSIYRFYHSSDYNSMR